MFQEIETDPSHEVDLEEVRVPKDDVYNPLDFETEASQDPRSSYGSLDGQRYPVYKYETKGGKGIHVKHDKMGTFWHIEFVPGGQLPGELQGNFTNDSEASHAVEQYLAKQD